MKRCLSVLLLLFAARAAPAQSITVPEKVQIDTPGLVVIRAKDVDADDVRWYSIGPGMQTFPADVVAPKPGVYLGFALQPGVYKIGVVCAKANKDGKAVISQPAVITVTVGNPAPPVPPQPPTPADTLAAAVQAAYSADPDPQKATYCAQLAAAYQYGLDTLASYRTLGELFNAVVAKAPPAGKMTGERAAIGAVLNATLSSPTDPINPATTAVVSTLFARVIAALKAAR